MPLNRNTLLRLRTIDSCLHRLQRKWTIEDLRKACQEALQQFEVSAYVSLRTTQRDLNLLRSDKPGYNAPIIVRQRKYYEYEDPNFSLAPLPLSDSDLVKLDQAMDLISEYQNFLGNSNDIIQTMLQRVKQLNNHQQIIFLDSNAQLKGLNFISTLYQSVVSKQSVHIQYQSFRSQKPSSFCLSVYVLKEFNNRWFAVGYESSKHLIMTLALDRFVSLSLGHPDEYHSNTFFDPQTYFDAVYGVIRELHDKPEKISLHFDANQAPYILTKPLHKSQQLISRAADGAITISLYVIPNLELQRLILGFGEHVEVLAPFSLRQHIATKLILASLIYHK